MKIELKEITIEDLVKGYEDNGDGGVIGYGGKLDIRPPYQREFIYKDQQRDAVIETIKQDFPLNVMYWAKRENGNFEIIDGQQRTVSICQYKTGEFSYKGKYFHNLRDDEEKQFLDYKLMIYQCSGTASERLAWFTTINIAGVKLTEQELRNAIYHGSWVTAAKKYFSRRGCPAYNIAKDYVKGICIRQDYLEAVIKWISTNNVEDYMGKHQHDKNAEDLCKYFDEVIKWVKRTFKKYRSQMERTDWGELYNEYHHKKLDADKIEEEVSRLMEDEEVQNKNGIYPYVLTRDKKKLSLRAFSDKIKTEIYEKQQGICLVCKKKFAKHEMEAHHRIPWIDGGETVKENCEMLCRDCHDDKGRK